MEKRKTFCVVLVCVMLGILVGESKAEFKECYELCFLGCAITPGNKLYSCATNCLAQCIFPQGSSGSSNGGQQSPYVNNKSPEAYAFCQLGCSIFSCVNFSTFYKPAGASVASCVNSCGKTCAINYSLP